MQTGISFAVGQLLAVVAPRTVLVVDAPTDWSLAGPLWELALDDAPVDEILDVLIRRGIRTAPSFAIVRVENDAVRALVRGSVPVCFERAGEPVRLDATGATSWLEGLISGARRVLVGEVDANTPMPYLVSTGVVLVSGLALPTSVAAPEPPLAPESREQAAVSREDRDVPDGPEQPAAPAATPIPASAGSPSASSSSAGLASAGLASAGLASAGPASAGPASGGPARVVDLTRTSNRPSSRSFAPADQADDRLDDRADLDRADDRADRDRVELDRAESDRAESDRAESDRIDLDRADLERADHGTGSDEGGSAEGGGATSATDGDTDSPAWPIGQRGADRGADLGYLNGHAPAVLAQPAPPEVVSAPAAPAQRSPSPSAFALPPAPPASAPPASAPPAIDDRAQARPELRQPPVETEAAEPRLADPDAVEAAPVAPAPQDAAPADPALAGPALAGPALEQPASQARLDARTGFEPGARPFEADSDQPVDDPFAPPRFQWSLPPAPPLGSAPAGEAPAFPASFGTPPAGASAPGFTGGFEHRRPDDDADKDRDDRAGDHRDEQVSPAEIDSSDLLIDAEPVGPSPTDLPSFDPPSLSLSLPPMSPYESGPGARYELEPPSPHSGLGAPAGWPPFFPSDRVNGSPQAPARYSNGFDRDAAPLEEDESAAPAGSGASAEAPMARSFEPERGFDPGPPFDSEQGYEPDGAFESQPFFTSEGDYEPDHRFAAPDRPFTLPEPPAYAPQFDEGFPVPQPAALDHEQAEAVADLPYRVRGQALRPEQREPLRSPSEPNGYLPSDPPLIPAPEGIPSPSRPVTPSAAGQPANASAQPMSGSLLLPAFFRGARAARSKPPAPAAPSAREGLPPAGRGPGTDDFPDDRMAPPSSWSPPMRRVFPDRSAAGGPPPVPGVLRSGGPGTSSPAYGVPGSEPDAPGFDPHGPAANGVRMSEPPREPPRLLGVWCDAGHVTSPDRPECRVCGLPVPPQAPILVARPPLGVLVFDNGDRVTVDRPVILGRDPKAVSSPDPEQPVLHAVQSATGQVSRTHAEIRASGWDVVLTDLEAMNGTALTAPGASPVAIEPGIPTVLTAGSRVDLGGESGFTFEIEG